MTEIDARVGAALREIQSAELENRWLAVEELARIVRELAEAAVRLLVVEPDGRYPVFERLGRFGSAVIAPLERALSEPLDDEARFLVSAALVALDSTAVRPEPARVARDELLAAIIADHPYNGVAMRLLSTAGVTEAIPRIEHVLRTCDLSDDRVLESFVEAMSRFKTPLPDDIRARLETLDPAWFRDGLLRP